MKIRKMLAILSAFVVGGLGIAALSVVPNTAEAGFSFN
jgi:hypothetical protein